MSALARRDEPDPWLVAEELCARGDHDAAEAFAKTAPRPDVQGLPAYVASRRISSDDAKRRARLAAANAALAARKFEEALNAHGPTEARPRADVVGVRLACARGTALSALSRFDEAVSTWMRAGQAAERIGWLSRAATAYQQAGSAAYRGSARAALRAAWERRLAVCERRSDRAATGEALDYLGRLHTRIGDYVTARSLHARALQIWEALRDRPAAASTLSHLGHVHHKLGELAEALSFYERALSAREALEDRAGAAAALAGVGLVQEALRDYLAALRSYEHALAAMRALEDRAGAARIQSKLGRVHDALGDYAGALPFYERALAAEEASGDRAGAARTRARIGLVHSRLGNHAKALSILEHALTAQETSGDKTGAARTLAVIGIVHTRRGEHALALSVLERALERQQAIGDEDGALATLNNIGLVHSRLGNHSKALPILERVLEATTTRDVGGIAATLGNIARARSALGDWRGAVEAARRAVRLLPLLVGGLANEQGATARDQWGWLTAIGTRAGIGLGDPGEMLFFTESGQAGALLEALGNRERISGFVIPPALRAAEAKARERERTALRSYQRALDRGEAVGELWKEVEAARTAILEVVQRIQREAKAQADLVYPEAAPLAAVQATLRPGETLVLYALLSEQESFALVVTAEQARIVALGRTNEILEVAEALQRAVSRPPAERGVAAPPHESFDYLARRLRRLVVAPLGLKATRLLVSPDGPLCYVPFAVLTDAEVAYVPSATTYLLLRGEERKSGERVLALGEPDYETERDATDLALYPGGQLAPLPNSGTEAKAVGDAVLLGRQATLAGLRKALRKQERWHAVHLACHGLIDPERPVLSALALSGDSLRCLDVYRMRIPSDLVVLSACETAKGKLHRTEGVVGWTRAFLFAGASRVLVSLWKVDDEATRALMVKFYELWNPKDGRKGLPTATALKRAQEYVRSREKWKHPYFWTAWQLWGLAE